MTKKSIIILFIFFICVVLIIVPLDRVIAALNISIYFGVIVWIGYIVDKIRDKL